MFNINRGDFYMKKIQLSKTGKKNRGKYEVLVDDDIFEEVNKFDWCYHHTGYACNSKMKILLHRYIWNLKFGDIPEGLDVEHKDQDKLNCQISNLRLATHSQNCRNKSKTKRNTSGYIGVSKSVKKIEYQDGIYIYEYWRCSWKDNLGKERAKMFSFNNVEKVRAARYYDLMAKQFAKEYQGELNFQSLEEYQYALKQAILEDIKSN